MEARCFFVGAVILLAVIFSSALFKVRNNLKRNQYLFLFALNFVFHFINILFIEFNNFKTGIYFNPFFAGNYGPLLWLYISSFHKKNHTINSRTIMYFTPSFISLISLIIFSVKFEVIYLITSSLLLVNIAYLFASYKYFKRKRFEYLPVEKKWLQNFLLFFALLILFAILNFLLFLSSEEYLSNNGSVLVFVASTILLGYLIYYSLINPELFSKLKSKYVNSNFSKKDSMELSDKIVTFLEQEKPYLEFNFSLDKLAKAVEASTKRTSQAINQNFHKSFCELINDYKIIQARKLLEEESNKDLAIKNIMYDSGFNTKTTFNKIFKEKTGLSPSEYRKINKTW